MPCIKPCNINKNDITLPETNIAPQNGWLHTTFLLGPGLFSGDNLLLVSGSVSLCHAEWDSQMPCPSQGITSQKHAPKSPRVLEWHQSQVDRWPNQSCKGRWVVEPFFGMKKLHVDFTSSHSRGGCDSYSWSYNMYIRKGFEQLYLSELRKVSQTCPFLSVEYIAVSVYASRWIMII